jgi:exopolysaccharide production protein ExoZ
MTRVSLPLSGKKEWDMAKGEAEALARRPADREFMKLGVQRSQTQMVPTLKLVSIQYLRAIAAMAVVMSHATMAAMPVIVSYDAMAGLALLGQAGVDLFFVISGFIMWTITDSPIRPGLFLWHRLIRIAPLYWIATLIMAIHLHAPATAIVDSLFFKPYFSQDGQIWPVLVQGWTLNYEMFFYVLISFVLFVPRPVALILLATTLCLLGLTSLSVAHSDPALLTYTNPLMLEFLAGIAVAELRLRAMLPRSKIALMLIATGVLAFWLGPMREPTNIWRFVWWGAPSVLIVTGAVSLEVQDRMFRMPPLRILGDASFSIYLCHAFIVKTALRACSSFPKPVSITAVLLASCGFGLFIFYFIERPMTNWLRNKH